MTKILIAHCKICKEKVAIPYPSLGLYKGCYTRRLLKLNEERRGELLNNLTLAIKTFNMCKSSKKRDLRKKLQLQVLKHLNLLTGAYS